MSVDKHYSDYIKSKRIIVFEDIDSMNDLMQDVFRAGYKAANSDWVRTVSPLMPEISQPT